MDLTQKIAYGMIAISYVVSSVVCFRGGYESGKIAGRATGIYQTIRDLNKMGLLTTSKDNAEAAMRGTKIYTSLLKDSRFKANEQDKKLVELVNEK